MNLKGAEGNKHSNTATPYVMVKPEIDAKAVVHFRPLNTWDGSDFGFDWLRIQDTQIDGDNNYASVVGSYGAIVAPDSGSVFSIDAIKYEDLKTTYYNPHTIKKKNKIPLVNTEEEYYVPTLTLFPKTTSKPDPTDQMSKNLKFKPTIMTPTLYTNTEAVLRLIVDIEEAPDKLEIIYDEKCFTIDKPVIYQSKSTIGYVQKDTPPMPNMFYRYKEFYLNGNLKENGLRCKKGAFQKGVWSYYDSTGKLTKEVDYDKPYKITWEQIERFISKKNIPLEKIFSISRKILVIEGTLWYILWEKKPDDGELITIDGDTGEIINVTYQNLRKEI